MEKSTTYKSSTPKRIGNLVFYTWRGLSVVRTNSGFTSETLKTDAKYVNARNTATEFGKVSSLCKAIRMTLSSILPKKNNLAVVNSFTKKMYEVMRQDTVSPRGKRNLAMALDNETTRQLLVGYDFNPEATIDLDYVIHESSIDLLTHGIIFPNRADRIGFRTHQLYFDFTTSEHQLQSSEWQWQNKTTLPNWLTLPLPVPENGAGVRVTILETVFYGLVNGSYLPVAEELKSVRVVAVC